MDGAYSPVVPAGTDRYTLAIAACRNREIDRCPFLILHLYVLLFTFILTP